MVDKIGRYEIQEQLGQGAMAVVYKAYDPDIDRTLAIKVLREEKCLDSEYRRRFLREAKAAGILSHANIATVYDVGEFDQRPYIVMEYLGGEPLDKVMADNEKLPLKKAVSIAMQLARALHFAHEKGIVHRDVKPSNIIFAKGGNSIKVTDFGIAHMESKDAAQQTQMGEVLGTPQYMSPEQVLGRKVDSRSDLFSLGVVLYQLLSNQKPFNADTLATLMFKIATEHPKPLREAAPEVPSSLLRIVEKLLNKKPEKRYQTGKEVTAALDKAMNEIEELERQRELPRIIPIRVKWTAAMALCVAVTMVVSSIVISKKQNALMLGQVIEYGSSLVKFIAVENAVPVLSEDWVSIELFVKDVAARQDFLHLDVVDYQNVARGSIDAKIIGNEYLVPGTESIIATTGDVEVRSYETSDGKAVFDFSAPILFQQRKIGRIYLGIPREPLEKVSQTTIYMMAILLAVTLLAVATATFVLGNRLSKPVDILLRGLKFLSEGDYDYRIERERNDEFGQLFLSFDKMAQSIHDKIEKDHDDSTGEASK